VPLLGTRLDRQRAALDQLSPAAFIDRGALALLILFELRLDGARLVLRRLDRPVQGLVAICGRSRIAAGKRAGEQHAEQRGADA
jgi:hypothetical protein